jgi:hypothetical protein
VCKNYKKNYIASVELTGDFPTTVITNTVSEQENRTHKQNYRSYPSFRFLKNFGKLNDKCTNWFDKKNDILAEAQNGILI